MPGKIEHRSVTPLLQLLKKIMRGRQINETLRFADCIAARTQPPPEVPGGPYHKTSKVYYYTRDARRLVQPPIEVYTVNQISAKKDASSEIKSHTPGKVYLPGK